MKKFLVLVLALTMVLGLAGFNAAAAYVEFAIEFQAVYGEELEPVEGAQIFLYVDDVAIEGYVLTDEHGVAVAFVDNPYAQFTVRVVAPEGWELDVDQLDSFTFIPAEEAQGAMLDLENPLVQVIFFAPAEVVAEEDEEDAEYEEYGYEEEYDYDEEAVEEVVAPAPVVAAPAPAPVAVSAELPMWPVRLFAFAPAW